MLTRIFVPWIALAAILGAALGGSFVWSFSYPPHAPAQEQHSPTEEKGAGNHPTNKAEEAIAEYTWWLTAFTGGLVLATIGLGIATVGLYLTGEKQVGLARDQFNATHRPELTVRHVRWAENHTAIAFTVANRGRNTCTIVESAFSYTTSEINNAVRTEGRNRLGEVVLSTGEFQDFVIRFNTAEEAFDAAFFVERVAAAALSDRLINEGFFAGAIVYRDESGIRRRLVFTRRWVRVGGAFHPTGSPDSEYTD